MNQHKKHFLLIFLILLVLSACQKTAPLETTSTQQTTTTSPPSKPSNTARISPSSTPQLLLSPTETPSITSTLSPTPINRNLAWTPLPPLTKTLSAENIDQLQEVAVWGSGKANLLQISPDGKTFAVGTDIGAYLYDSETFIKLALIPTAHPVRAIAFDSNNRLIALGLSDGHIDMVSQGSYKRISQLSFANQEIQKEDLFKLYFAQNDTQIIGVVEQSEEITIKKWSAISFEEVDSFVLENGYGAYVTPELGQLGIIKDRELFLQSLTYTDETGRLSLPGWLPSSFLDSLRMRSGEIIPSATGDFLLINNRFSIIHWKISQPEMTYQINDYPQEPTDPCFDAPPTCYNINGEFSWECKGIPNDYPVETAALTPDSLMVLISTNQGKTELRHANDGQLVWEIEAEFKTVLFSPDSTAVFGLREDGIIEKRNTLDGELLNILDLHPSQLTDIVFSPDSGVIAAGFSDGYIRVYSAMDGSMLGVLPGNASSLDFSPDGTLLGAGLIDGIVRIFKLFEGEEYDLPINHLAAVTDIEFSQSGGEVLAASMDCTLSIWELSTRNRILYRRVDFENPYQINAAQFSIDEQSWYAVGNSQNLTQGIGFEAQNTALSSPFGYNDIALALNGLWLAAAGAQTWLLSLDQTGGITDAVSIKSDGNENFSLAFSPNSKILALADAQSLHFFSPDEKSLLHKIRFSQGLEMQPVALAFSPNGTMVALGGSNGLITIYAIP